jgi:O-antigen/teichoic acid export membrane protein
MTAVVVGMGLNHAFAYLAAARIENARMASSLAVWSGVLAGGLSVAVGWVLVRLVVHDHTAETVVRIGLLAVPATVIATNIVGVFQGLRLGRRFNASRVLQPSAYCAGIVAVALIAEPVTPEALAGAYVVAAFASAAGAYYLLSPAVRSLRWPSREFTSSAVRYGVVSGIGAAALTANTLLAIPVLGAVAGLRETGFFAIALAYATPVTLVASAIAIHTFPDVAAADSWVRTSLVRRRLALSLGTLLPMVVAGVLAAPLLLPFAVGDEFRPAVPSAQILVIAQALRALCYVLADIGRGLGRPVVPSIAETAGLLVTAGLLPLVVPGFGSEGAAIVAVAASAVVGLVLARGVKRTL